MEHTYKITFKEGTTRGQMSELLSWAVGTLNVDVTKNPPLYTLETERQPMDILFGPYNQIVEDLEMIGFTGETV